MGNAYHGKNGAHGFQASVRSASYHTKSARSGEAKVPGFWTEAGGLDAAFAAGELVPARTADRVIKLNPNATMAELARDSRAMAVNSCCPRWGAALAAEFESRAKAKAKASEKVS